GGARSARGDLDHAFARLGWIWYPHGGRRVGSARRANALGCLAADEPKNEDGEKGHGDARRRQHRCASAAAAQLLAPCDALVHQVPPRAAQLRVAQVLGRVRYHQETSDDGRSVPSSPRNAARPRWIWVRTLLALIPMDRETS